MACPSAACIGIGQPVPFRCNRFVANWTDTTNWTDRTDGVARFREYVYIHLMPNWFALPAPTAQSD